MKARSHMVGMGFLSVGCVLDFISRHFKCDVCKGVERKSSEIVWGATWKPDTSAVGSGEYEQANPHKFFLRLCAERC